MNQKAIRIVAMICLVTMLLEFSAGAFLGVGVKKARADYWSAAMMSEVFKGFWEEVLQMLAMLVVSRIQKFVLQKIQEKIQEAGGLITNFLENVAFKILPDAGNVARDAIVWYMKNCTGFNLDVTVSAAESFYESKKVAKCPVKAELAAAARIELNSITGNMGTFAEACASAGGTYSETEGPPSGEPGSYAPGETTTSCLCGSVAMDPYSQKCVNGVIKEDTGMFDMDSGGLMAGTSVLDQLYIAGTASDTETKSAMTGQMESALSSQQAAETKQATQSEIKPITGKTGETVTSREQADKQMTAAEAARHQQVAAIRGYLAALVVGFAEFLIDTFAEPWIEAQYRKYDEQYSSPFYRLNSAIEGEKAEESGGEPEGDFWNYYNQQTQ